MLSYIMKSYYKTILLLTIIAGMLPAAVDLNAQNIQSAIRDYERGHLDNVRSALIELKDKDYDKPEYLFLSAVFEQNGERAFSLYRQINAFSPDNPLYERVLWKMCQFLYAKDLYEECGSSVSRFMTEFPDSDLQDEAREMYIAVNRYFNREIEVIRSREDGEVNTEEPDVIYTLQFGAFGTESRARTLLSYLKNLGISQVFLSEQLVGQRKLYKVQSGEFKNKDDAESVRQFAIYLKSGGKTLEGAKLENFVPDKERLKKILSFEFR